MSENDPMVIQKCKFGIMPQHFRRRVGNISQALPVDGMSNQKTMKWAVKTIASSRTSSLHWPRMMERESCSQNRGRMSSPEVDSGCLKRHHRIRL